MRPFSPFCGTVSNAQLLSLLEIIRMIAPGVVTTQLSHLPPASSSATEVAASSDSRLATAQPPLPAPTTTKSNVSVTVSPPGPLFYFRRVGWRRRRVTRRVRRYDLEGGLRRVAPDPPCDS